MELASDVQAHHEVDHSDVVHVERAAQDVDLHDGALHGWPIYAHMGIIVLVARAATTADAFNAVAEPRRREILDLLAGGEWQVNDLVGHLGLTQPQVSKHLRVLRKVGAVGVREEGRRHFYRLNAEALKPIHDWVKDYERLWTERFDRLDVVLEGLKHKKQGDGDGGE